MHLRNKNTVFKNLFNQKYTLPVIIVANTGYNI